MPGTVSDSGTTPKAFNVAAEAIRKRGTSAEKRNCVLLNGASLVGIGEFVLDSSGSLGQVICVEERRDISEEELEVCGLQSGKNGNARDRFMLVRLFPKATTAKDVVKHNDVPANLVEVVESCSVTWRPIDTVEDIAFAFHIDDIQDLRHLVAGVANAFCISSRQDTTGKVESLSKKEWNPWWSPHGDDYESYSRRIYNGLVSIEDTVFRAMNYQGKCKGRNKHLHFPGFSYELMMCLKPKDLDGAITKKHSQHRARKRQLPNIGVANKRLKTDIELVRHLSQSSVDWLRSRLGIGFAVANSKPAPTLKRQKEFQLPDSVPCLADDEVRIVDVDAPDLDASKHTEPMPDLTQSGEDSSLEETNPKLYKTPCPFPGIDIQYKRSEFGLTDLHVNVKYKLVRGDSPAVAKAMCGSDVGSSIGGTINATNLKNECF